MTKRRSNIRLMTRGGLLFMLLLAAALPGCKKKEVAPSSQVTPLPKKTQQAQVATPVNAVQTKISSAKKQVAASPVQKQMSTATRLQPAGTVSLDFTNRRDPFKPYVQAPASPPTGQGKSGKTKIRDPLPIQRVEVEKFKVTGIITGLKENSALVVDPTGKGYVLKVGMLIGNSEGQVKRITNSAVEVEEIFSNDAGHVRKRLVKLMLIRKK